MIKGRRIRVRGQVQGVGFRPFVWQLANRMGLSGDVLNDAEGVLIRIAGTDLDAFEAALRDEVPPLARIDAVEALPYHFPSPPQRFVIAASEGGGAQTGVVPDAATCPDCLAEIFDPTQRRYGYAFANCTHCGPRFSILRSVPYDRDQTSMAAFEMCADCAAEYTKPADRRFHAQPIACPVCGPRLWLEVDGTKIAGDPIAQAAVRLRAGEILAIKGLGGFHLACDAHNADTVDRLRARKHRPSKPFALMGTAAMIAEHAWVSSAEAAILASASAPIVLLSPRNTPLAPGIAPGLAVHGWMLPYTPLHHLLLAAFGGPLVMTSGNLSGEPQVIGNREAVEKLGHVADAFLMHDRDIERRLDDSVERITPHGRIVMRRARGLAPGTLPLPPGFADAPEVVAYGGQMKAAICLLKDGQALLSHHLGDLDDALTWAEFQRADADYAALFDHHPTLVACDLNSDYRASRFAAARGLPLVQVQHHHAHLAACLADNLWPLEAGPVAGIVLDGLGLGNDGTFWGGEVMLGDYRSFARAANLSPAPLIGGDKAAIEPYRNLLVRLDQAGLGGLMDELHPDLPLALLRQVAKAGVNAPMSSSMGRLFDAFAAALGLMPGRQSYEGEAAMRLEALAASVTDKAEPYPMTTGVLIDPSPLFQAWADDRSAKIPPASMATRFHAGVAKAFADGARQLVESGAAKAVALSGGCFQNAVLLAMTLRALEGVPVMIHRSTPPNDGSLALGQALVAAAQSL
ncbi:carbamoyltransferase HypF [Tabrizicola sp.]|uniref:carbamoyltransferase HypF n=1 Tax=Tabrizicola sp. TaxID=2005166 RepID=UPI003F3AA9C5